LTKATIGTQGSTTFVEEQEQEVAIPSPPPPPPKPPKRPPPALPDSLISLSLGLVSLAASFFSRSWLLTLASTSLIASGMYSIYHKQATGRTFRGAVRWFAGSTFLIAYECVVMTTMNPVFVIPKLIITATVAACVAFSYTRAVKLVFIGNGGRRRRRRYEDEEEEMGGVQSSSLAGTSSYATSYGDVNNNGATSNSNSSGRNGDGNSISSSSSASAAAAYNSMQEGDSQTSISLDHDIESYSSSDYDEDFSYDELPNRGRRKKNKETNKNDPLTRSIDQVNEAMGGIIREEIFTTNPWAFINTLVLLTGAVIYDNGVWTAWDVTFGDSPEWSSLTAVVVGLLIVASVRIFKIPVVSKIPWQEEE